MTALPVLMYHAVSELRGRLRPLGVPGGLLADQLAALQRHDYRLVGLTEALARHGRGEGRVVALTFDDAFADFATAALPVLEELGARATLYVPSAHVGRRAAWLGDLSDQVPRLLSWDELEICVAGGGVEVGSHSLTHPHMDLLRREDLAHEIAGSRATLRNRLGIEVRSFCYPHGYHSARVRAAVRAAGYDNACEVGRRLRSPRDRWAVSRLAVGPAHTPERLLQELASGGPRVLPAVKRGLQPAWRQVRRAGSGAGLMRAS